MRRGDAPVISAMLMTALTLALVGTYYVFVAGQTGQLTGTASKELQVLMDAAKNLKIISAQITMIDPATGLVRVKVVLFNEGSIDVPYSGAGMYLYDDYKLTDQADSVISPDCPTVFPAGQVCELNTLMFYTPNGDLSTARVVVYVNGYRLSAPLVATPSDIPPTVLYCGSCSECTSVISTAPTSSYVVADFSTATGDCITISRDGVYLLCKRIITGNGTGTGLSIVDANDVVIQRCTFTNFGTGIYLTRSSNIYFVNVSAVSNGLDVNYDVDSTSTCALADVSLTTTNGSVVYFRGATGSKSVYNASAVWIYNSSDLNVSFLTSSMAGVSPALLLCSTSRVSVSGATIDNTPLGIYLLSDSNSDLNGITVDTNVYLGLLSKMSGFGVLNGVTLLSQNGALFDTTDSMELVDLNVS